MPKLTDLSIKTLPLPHHGQITYDDDNSPLKLRVSQGGAKTFIVMLGSGKRRTIGRYGEVSLTDAREAARRLRAEKTLGRILPHTVHIDQARKEYLSEITVRPATFAYYERNLNLLKGRLTEITAHDLHRILDTLTEASRNQAIASFRAFFSWCIRRHYLDISPSQRLTLTKQKSRERTLRDAELKAIWIATEEPTSFHRIVRMCLLTGQRKSEIAAIHSSWIKDETITFPASITKNKHSHSIPLTPLAQSIIPPCESLKFPSEKTRTPINGWNKLKAALDKKTGVKDYTLHDLRRTFATRLAELGIQPFVIERCLNHRSGSMTPLARTYNRATYQKEMLHAFHTYETYISCLISS